jgi:hypothetical protein
MAPAMRLFIQESNRTVAYDAQRQREQPDL